MSKPLDTIRRETREAQEGFAADVDLILGEMKACTAALLPTVGELSHTEALEQFRTVAIRAIDRCYWARLRP